MLLWGLDVLLVMGLLVVAITSSSGQDTAGKAMIWGLTVAAAIPLALSVLVRRWSTSGAANGISWATAIIPLAGMLIMGGPLLSQHLARSRTEDGSRFFASDAARSMAAAMARNDTSAMRQIAASKLDLNAVGKSGTTLMTFGVMYAPSAIPLLIDLGADPRFAPPGADSPVAQAVYSSSRALESLLKKGVPPVDRDGEHLAFYAMRQDQRGVLNLLLHYGADAKTTDRKGVSMLMRAAQQRLWAEALTMIERGADPTYVAPNGDTLASIMDLQLSRLDSRDRSVREYVQLRQRLEKLGVKLAIPLPLPAES